MLFPHNVLIHVVDHLFDVPASRANSVAQVALLVGLVIHVFLRGSRDTVNFILAMIRIMIGLAMRNGQPEQSLTVVQENILAGIPASVRDALAMFTLNGRCTVWAVCPHLPLYLRACVEIRLRGSRVPCPLHQPCHPGERRVRDCSAPGWLRGPPQTHPTVRLLRF